MPISTVFTLLIMAEPPDRRSACSRKLIVHFDDKIAQSLVLPKPPKPTKLRAKPAKPAKPAKKPPKSTLATLATLATSLAKPLVSDDAVEELGSQLEGLDIREDLKTKKKAKATEITRLTTLSLQGIMEEAKPLKDVQFEAFDPRVPRELQVNIPANIDPSDPLALLDLFIPLEIYTLITENTNLYTIASNALITPTPTN
jgi:hypothetical protein